MSGMTSCQIVESLTTNSFGCSLSTFDYLSCFFNFKVFFLFISHLFISQLCEAFQVLKENIFLKIHLKLIVQNWLKHESCTFMFTWIDFEVWMWELSSLKCLNITCMFEHKCSNNMTEKSKQNARQTLVYFSLFKSGANIQKLQYEQKNSKNCSKMASKLENFHFLIFFLKS